jgi:type VI secretion system FHA domain protein
VEFPLPMFLTLSVLTYRNQPPARALSATLRGNDGTIGRLEQNTLVLPDPDRVISRTHARVDFRAGSYFITALGQNPIDLNGRALGAGETAQLSAGDKLTIGEYCIAADVQGQQEGESPLADILTRPSKPFAPAESFDLGMGAESGGGFAFGIPLTGGSSSEATSRPAGTQQLITRGIQQRDEIPGFHEPLAPSRGTAHIPDDYDFLRGLDDADQPASRKNAEVVPPQVQSPLLLEDPFAETVPVERMPVSALKPPQPVTPPARPAASASVANPSHSEGPAKTPAAPPPASAPAFVPTDVDYIKAVRDFLAVAGVPELESRALADPDFVRNAGELLRESIAGLQKSLVARALTKGALRLDMTMLSSAENNPLKFSPNAYEALTHLLAPRAASGYLPPLRAVREAFQDLEAHNLAVMAGMRAALLGVLQRFDPAKVEKRLGSNPLLEKLLPAKRKARMWDLVAEQHGDMVREAQDEFERIFGRAFRDAYQEQVEKLRAAARRSSSLL